jgi:hypothetical protein
MIGTLLVSCGEQSMLARCALEVANTVGMDHPRHHLGMEHLAPRLEPIS